MKYLIFASLAPFSHSGRHLFIILYIFKLATLGTKHTAPSPLRASKGNITYVGPIERLDVVHPSVYLFVCVCVSCGCGWRVFLIADPNFD